MIETAKFRIKFTEPSLATTPGNRSIVSEYKQGEAGLDSNGSKLKLTPEQKQEELDALPTDAEMEAILEKASTVFPKDETGIFAWNYQIKGAIKDWMFGLIELGEIKKPTRYAYKRAVDQFLVVNPRRCYYLDQDGKILTAPQGVMERGAVVDTMRGRRSCLMRSELVNPGAMLEFTVTVQVADAKSAFRIDMDMVRACLERGLFMGFSQWRGSGGMGLFTYDECV